MLQTDSLGRRSRFHRCETGKQITLVKRDIEILSLLYRYRYLRQRHLLAFLKPNSKKRFVERLGDLFHETGLIGRPQVQHRHFDSRCTPIIYEITRSGIAYLENLGALPHRVVTFSLRTSRANNPQFLHTMMIIDALIETELSISETPDQRFVPVDEILVRAPENARLLRNPLRVPVTLKPCSEHPVIRSRQESHLIPDGLYGIEYLIEGEKRYRFWALECERTSPGSRANASASSTAFKRAAYDALIKSKAYKSHWGIPNLKLHLVSSDDHDVSGRLR